MEQEKIGALIRAFRRKKGYTQRELGEALFVTDKAVSKWERGLGLPDVSSLSALSSLLGLDLEAMLKGTIEENDMENGNMKKSSFYVCPSCGNIILQTGDGCVSCCGTKLEKLNAKKAEVKLTVEKTADEYYISSEHEMSKENYISFIALVTGESVLIRKLYPEWTLDLRLPLLRHSTLYWYSEKEGLQYQYLI